MSMVDVDDMGSAPHALQIAFQTMQERCQQLQKRLTIVEEENMALRLERGSEKSDKYIRENSSNQAITIANLQVIKKKKNKMKVNSASRVFSLAKIIDRPKIMNFRWRIDEKQT